MGFWKNFLFGNRDDSKDDLNMNSKRIQTNENEIGKLQSKRDNIPRWQTMRLGEIDSEIEKRQNRLDYLRKRRDELHEKNYKPSVDDSWRKKFR